MSATPEPSISTHVLDTERGEPAVGVPVSLSRWDGPTLLSMSTQETDQDGRIRDLVRGRLEPGSYRLAFDVGTYFRRRGDEPAFLMQVVIDFGVSDGSRHYHVPLLLSSYSCASYRGS